MNSIKVLLFLAMIVLVASVAESHHKKFIGAPQYGGPQREECVCDCGLQHGPLPNRPFYGSGGYHQPRPSGYGSSQSGAFATAGSYGSGAGQTSGGY